MGRGTNNTFRSKLKQLVVKEGDFRFDNMDLILLEYEVLVYPLFFFSFFFLFIFFPVQ